MTTGFSKEPSSFRDPSGFVFTQNGHIYRQVNKQYQTDYNLLHSSGLYESLVAQHLLIEHHETDISPAEPSQAYKVIEPKKIPFISYPYEWSFSQLKDAALTTLRIQQIALEHQMSLKDASAYNIQFHDGEPVLIDTLSFERYTNGAPWVAYRQFCRHFLAPLALMSFTDIRLQQLLRVHIDGIPLDLAVSLLPAKTKTKFGLITHLHLHAKSEKHYEHHQFTPKKHQVKQQAMFGIIDSLKKTISKLRLSSQTTEWSDYYDRTNYSKSAFTHKKTVVKQYLNYLKPASVWDIGANNGNFSRLATDMHIPTLSFDIDPLAVEQNYRQIKESGTKNLLPLLMDITNPSPAIGWQNKERKDLLSRGQTDTVMALALIHHLAFSNNLTLPQIAAFFDKLTTRGLILEFVPKTDSQVEWMLSSREDIFDSYTEIAFEEAFSRYFEIVEKTTINDSSRILYLFSKS